MSPTYHDYSNYLKSLKVLDLSAKAVNLDLAKSQYLEKIKEHHPDSQTVAYDQVDLDKIKVAYKNVVSHLSEKQAIKDRLESIDEDAMDLVEGMGCADNSQKDKFKPNVQQRQYLSNQGHGFGNQFQRDKQFSNIRAAWAQEAMFQRQYEKAAEDKEAGTSVTLSEKKHIRRSKSVQAIERLAEDLILESMSKGEFNDLNEFAGKPLPTNEHVYLDFHSAKINDIMKKSGYTPEWITLEAEIRKGIKDLRDEHRRNRQQLGPDPLKGVKLSIWHDDLRRLKERIDFLNQKINKFNLIVPILDKQRVQFKYQTELHILEEFAKTVKEVANEKSPEHQLSSTDDSDAGLKLIIGCFLLILLTCV